MCVVEVGQRTAAIRDPLGENDFPFFEIADTLLVGGDDRRHVGIGDAVEKLFDLPLDR